jgi:hypothetical protein
MANKNKIKTSQPTETERMDKFKSEVKLILGTDNSQFEIMEALLNTMYTSFGTFDTNEAISRTLDNHYIAPNEIGCFIGKHSVSDVIPLVAQNLNDVSKLEVVNLLLKLDSQTLDKIANEHNL